MKTRIEYIAPDPEGRLIAVSDIHGCVRYLEGLLKKLSFTRRDTLVIVGDSIEKGPKSLETVRFILKLMAGGYQVHTVMGNVDYGRTRRLMEDGPEAGIHLLDLLRWTKREWKRGLRKRPRRQMEPRRKTASVWNRWSPWITESLLRILSGCGI